MIYRNGKGNCVLLVSCLHIDNHTNQIVAPAPIFDNGLSLLCYAMEDDLADDSQYIKTRHIVAYHDFIEFVKPLMTYRQKEKVRKLLDFHFTNHRNCRLPKKRLKKLEKIIQKRVKRLLD